MFEGLPESHGQNLALPVLDVPSSLESRVMIEFRVGTAMRAMMTFPVAKTRTRKATGKHTANPISRFRT